MTKYDIEESLPMLMANCVKFMRESLNATFLNAGFDITQEQWNILVYLGHEDGISQQVLADRYGRSKVSTMNLLKKLEKQGLVLRETHPTDARYNCVYLTVAGRMLQKTLIPLAKGNIQRMSKGISDDEIELLKTLVRKISKNLNQPG